MQKELLVINLFVFFIFSCSSNKNIASDNDSIFKLIANDIQSKNINNVICFNKSNNNLSVVSLIKESKIATDKGGKELEEFKQINGIKNDSELNLIFNPKDYNSMISQESNSFWDDSRINNFSFCNVEANTIYTKKVYISKPIYTKDKTLALIYINKGGSSSYILVLKREKENWKEIKIISPTI